MTEVDYSGSSATWAHTNAYAGDVVATYLNDGQGPHYRLTDWLVCLAKISSGCKIDVIVILARRFENGLGLGLEHWVTAKSVKSDLECLATG